MTELSINDKILEILYDEISIDHGEVSGYSDASIKLLRLILSEKIELLQRIWDDLILGNLPNHIITDKLSELSTQLNNIKNN